MGKNLNSRRLVAALFTTALLSSGVAAADLKIAVLDTQQALAESEEAKNLIKTINRELKGEQDEVKTLGESIRRLTEKLEKDGQVMSATEQRKAAKEIEDKQIEYQFLVNKLQKEVNDRRNELLQQMVPKVDAVLKDLIDKERYDLILERGSLRYANPKHDVTRKVTEMLNKKR